VYLLSPRIPCLPKYLHYEISRIYEIAPALDAIDARAARHARTRSLDAIKKPRRERFTTTETPGEDYASSGVQRGTFAIPVPRWGPFRPPPLLAGRRYCGGRDFSMIRSPRRLNQLPRRGYRDFHDLRCTIADLCPLAVRAT